MIRPKALLFDLDGTLVDSRRDIAEACNAALVAHGRAPLPLERISTMIGDGARLLVARAFELPENDPVVGEALVTFKAHYEAHPCVHTTLLPGARAALDTGLRSALVTNKPRAITVLLLEALGIRGSFEAIWGGEGPLKPSPAGILAVLDQMKLAPADVWFVGDGPQDVGAGKAAGCFTVAVDGAIASHASVRAAGPDLVVGDLNELVARL